MSIKSDRWIKRMAAQGMIEPYSPEQVRMENGHKIVSYGTSSYGYDVRCAQEFKIFTNINSTIVDPKAFDEKSFVDFNGAVCIIPPNSFALARTVEFFRIPRSILTVCLGKCVTGDTRVVDADTGAYVPITDMRWGKSTLGLDSGKLKTAKISAFVPQGRKQVFELRTGAGLRIRATANHPFRQLDTWTPLSELRPGDRIAAARNIPLFGNTPIPDWEASLLGLMISAGQCDTPVQSPIYTTSDPAMLQLLNNCVEGGGLGMVRPDGNYAYRLVNQQRRGGVAEHNQAHLWLQKHGLNVGGGEKFVPQTVFTAPEHSVRLFLQSLFSGDGNLDGAKSGVFFEFDSESRRLIEDVHHLLLRFGVLSLIREKSTTIGAGACKIQISDEEQVRRFAERVGFSPNSLKQQKLEADVLPLIRPQPRIEADLKAPPPPAWQAVGVAAHASGPGVGGLDISPSTSTEQAMPCPIAARGTLATQELFLSAVLAGPFWDVIESIEPAGEEEVYDISVPVLHNFVANGLIVHNSTYARCGIICNVTPLEPEWEGHVTLEFSNTTPLPAKIYANEGVAQMLFFESDEICETSYKDRGGKYQGQRGVTLPKA